MSTKLTGLTATTALTDADLIYVVDGSDSRKITFANLKAAVGTGRFKIVNDGEITRDVGGLVTTVVIGGQTITINRNVNDVITGWEDTGHTWTLTRDGNGNITNWGAVAK